MNRIFAMTSRSVRSGSSCRGSVATCLRAALSRQPHPELRVFVVGCVRLVTGRAWVLFLVDPEGVVPDEELLVGASGGGPFGDAFEVALAGAPGEKISSRLAGSPDSLRKPWMPPSGTWTKSPARW